MAVLQDYNLIKEGNAYNSAGLESTLQRHLLSPAAINALYSGSTSPVTTITGSTVSGTYISIDIVFGETYSAHTLRYYQNLATTSGIGVTYGVDSPVDYEAVVTLASGIVETQPLGDVRFIRLQHSCSPGVVVEPSQLVLLGVENEYIGFGAGPSSQHLALFSPSSPVGMLGSYPLEVPLYNRHNGPIDINVAVKPTGSYRDGYLRIGTTDTGTYYGINEYGKGTTQTEMLSLQDDAMVGAGLSDLSAQWRPSYGNVQCSVLPTADGVTINTSADYGISEVSYGGASSFFGLVSASSFSANQSFTLRAKIKATKLSRFAGGSIDVVMGFSAGFPAISESYNLYYPQVDEYSPLWAVRSGACIGWSTDVGGIVESEWGDGISTDRYRLSVNDGGLSQVASISREWYGAGAISASDFSKFLYGAEDGNLDGTSAAPFRELILTWDHVDRLVEGFIDKVKVGSYRMSVPPTAGCRVFIGALCDNQPVITLVVKDFEVDTKNLYVQKRITADNGILSVSSATSGDIIDHPAENVVAAKYPHYDYLLAKSVTTTGDDCWCSEDPPNTYESLVLGFAETDILAVELYTPSSMSSSSFGGVSASETFGLTPNTVLVTASGVSEHRQLPATLGYRTMVPTVASGVSSLEIAFVDYHTQNATADHMSAILSNVVVVSEGLSAVTVFPSTPDPGLVPWTRGVFKNMAPKGSTSSWSLYNTAVREVSRVNDTEGLYRGIDYDVSSAFSYTDQGLSLPASANPQVIFRSREVDEESSTNWFGSWHWYSHPAWVWRRFSQSTRVVAVSFSWGSSQNVAAEQGYPNKFKFQYLLPGGVPSEEASWADVPPVALPWPFGGDYATYKQWFIDHNDGEYYTGTAFAFPGDPGMPSSIFEAPAELSALKDYRWSPWTFTAAGAVVNEIYLELDSYVETEAIRVVIAESLDATRTVTVDLMNLFRVGVFSDTTYGVYTSPVFDTGTANNTERLFTATSFSATSSGTVYTRSSSVSPVWPKDASTLSWQPWQVPFQGSVYDVAGGEVDPSAADVIVRAFGDWPHFGVVRGSRVYLIPTTSSYYPMYYDYTAGEWGSLAKMGPDSEDIRADSRVTNNAVVLDDGNLYVAVRYGNVNDARIARYDFEPDAYNISGWRHLGVNRPESASEAAMVGYGQSLYFFCSDGTTIEFDVDAGTWDPTLESTPLHGHPYRRYAWPVVIGSKAYLIGGSYTDVCGYIDEFDFVTKTWRTLVQLEVSPTQEVQAVVFGSRIYVLPRLNSFLIEPGYAIFDVETGALEYGDFYRLSSCRFLTNNTTYEICGASWVYDGMLYSYQRGYGGTGRMIKRCNLDRGSWSAGYLPAQYDTHWGSTINQASWVPVSSYGELLPQERYFQFKVVLSESTSSGTQPPVLRKTTVVQPQQVELVPVSGTKSFYIKLGVSDDDMYLGWYSSNRAGESSIDSFSGYYSTIYNTNFNFSYVPTDASKAIASPPFPFAGTSRASYFNPCVLPGPPFKMWASTALSYTGNTYVGTTASGQVVYSTSADGLVWSPPTQVISYDLTTLSGACGSAVHSPCVLQYGPADYWMWYSCEDLAGTTRIGRSTSSDGVLWVGAELAQDVGTSGLSGQADLYGADRPWVVHTDAGYHMWYTGTGPSGYTSIVACVSSSGTSWHSHRVVVPRGFAGPYDEAGATNASVVFDVGEFKMWYTGVDALGVTRVLYTSSADGVSWSTPSLSLSPGLSGDDSAGLGRLSVLVNRVPENYNQYITDLSVKIHD